MGRQDRTCGRYVGTSCGYGLFGCVKIATYSGGVNKSLFFNCHFLSSFNKKISFNCFLSSIYLASDKNLPVKFYQINNLVYQTLD